MNPLFLEAVPILETLEEAGYEAVFVGGSVRDSILKHPIQDVDIATNATPEVVQHLFPKTIPIGIQHGTILVRFLGKSYEVTTYRIDGEYKDFRHPDRVEFVSNLRDDLARRDFTINAIAMNKSGRIIDPFNGKQDIVKKLIQTVHDPNNRFQEDPLRIMRALRFLSQLGFTLHVDTRKAMEDNRHLLENIAIERIAVEMEKLFLGKYLKEALKVVVETKVYSHLPLLKKDNSLIEKCIDYVETPFLSIAEWIVFIHLLNRKVPIDTWCKEWKLSNEIKNKCKQLASAFYRYEIEGLSSTCLYLLHKNIIPEFIHLIHTLSKNTKLNSDNVQLQYDHLPIKTRKDLDINGADIKQLLPERKPGPWINELFSKMEEHVLNGRLTNIKKDLEDWVLTWIQEKN